jgi:2-phospho-L-lactate transferase/gluconeogenesis factor (CofD/UPF0052 family)
VYVTNVATQVGETEGFSLRDHLAALAAHLPSALIDVVVANDNFAARTPQNYPATPVRLDVEAAEPGLPRIVRADVVDDENAHHHDPKKLAATVIGLIETEASPRSLALARSA